MVPGIYLSTNNLSTIYRTIKAYRVHTKGRNECLGLGPRFPGGGGGLILGPELNGPVLGGGALNLT
jgi:hypothetical protein